MNHVDKCLEKYFKPGEIISWKNFVTHDGYDRYGPESNLFDLVVLSRRKKLLYYSFFHREYWYRGEDDEQFYRCGKLYRNLTNKLEKENYYQLEKIKILTNLLLIKFPDLVVDLILKYLVKNIIDESILKLDKKYLDLSTILTTIGKYPYEIEIYIDKPN